MAEQFANVIRTTAAAATGTDHVDAIANAITAGGTRWTVPNSEPGRALLDCIATGAQLVLHGTATQIQIGYAPDGGITDWNGTPTAPVFSGMRNLTGTATAFSSVTAKVDIAEYEDALLLAIGSTTSYWRFAAMAGRVIEPVDTSDITRKIGIDALLVGVPSNVAAAGAWLYSTTADELGSCVRAGNAFFPIALSTSFVFTPNFVASQRILARVGSTERFVPYMVHILVSTGVGQYLGATKYIRQWRALVSHGTRLFSETPGSDQAWHGHQYGPGDRNQFVLWAKTETTL